MDLLVTQDPRERQGPPELEVQQVKRGLQVQLERGLQALQVQPVKLGLQALEVQQVKRGLQVLQVQPVKPGLQVQLEQDPQVPAVLQAIGGIQVLLAPRVQTEA